MAWNTERSLTDNWILSKGKCELSLPSRILVPTQTWTKFDPSVEMCNRYVAVAMSGRYPANWNYCWILQSLQRDSSPTYKAKNLWQSFMATQDNRVPYYTEEAGIPRWFHLFIPRSIWQLVGWELIRQDTQLVLLPVQARSLSRSLIAFHKPAGLYQYHFECLWILQQSALRRLEVHLDSLFFVKQHSNFVPLTHLNNTKTAHQVTRAHLHRTTWSVSPGGYTLKTHNHPELVINDD